MSLPDTRARATNVVVGEAKSLREQTKERPAHHLDDTQTHFENPWPSFRFQTKWQWLEFYLRHLFMPMKIPKDLSARIPSRRPDWSASSAPDKIKATWLGHASFCVELPTPEGASRAPPCPAEEIPAVDVICISHNHYDHMDLPTLRTIFGLHQPQIFVPLGNRDHLRSIDIPDSHIHTLDWWDACTVSLSLPHASPSNAVDAHERKTDAGVETAFVVTCTPAQHTANRGAFDRWRTLWASWAVEQVSPMGKGPNVYFAGDTGYRTVRDGEDEDKVPRCPAFAEIGEKLGPFDLAMLPIGAYGPRSMWSNLHASPSDAVQIFKDVRASRALGMHWATFPLTFEPILEPPELLKQECAKEGLVEGTFDISGLGETKFI